MPQSFVTRGLALPSSRILGRQAIEARHFPHRAQLWRPAKIKPLEGLNRNPLGTAASDMAYELACPEGREGQPEAAIVSCCYIATPETDPAKVENALGRTKDDNIFTLDKYLFPSGVKILDTWVIVFLEPGDNFGDVQIVQGNPQSETNMPFQHRGGTAQLVYVKLAPTTPRGVDLSILANLANSGETS